MVAALESSERRIVFMGGKPKVPWTTEMGAVLQEQQIREVKASPSKFKTSPKTSPNKQLSRSQKPFRFPGRGLAYAWNEFWEIRRRLPFGSTKTALTPKTQLTPRMKDLLGGGVVVVVAKRRAGPCLKSPPPNPYPPSRGFQPRDVVIPERLIATGEHTVSCCFRGTESKYYLCPCLGLGHCVTHFNFNFRNGRWRHISDAKFPTPAANLAAASSVNVEASKAPAVHPRLLAEDWVIPGVFSGKSLADSQWAPKGSKAPRGMDMFAVSKSSLPSFTKETDHRRWCDSHFNTPIGAESPEARQAKSLVANFRHTSCCMYKGRKQGQYLCTCLGLGFGATAWNYTVRDGKWVYIGEAARWNWLWTMLSRAVAAGMAGPSLFTSSPAAPNAAIPSTSTSTQQVSIEAQQGQPTSSVQVAPTPSLPVPSAATTLPAVASSVAPSQIIASATTTSSIAPSTVVAPLPTSHAVTTPPVTASSTASSVTSPSAGVSAPVSVANTPSPTSEFDFSAPVVHNNSASSSFVLDFSGSAPNSSSDKDNKSPAPSAGSPTTVPVKSKAEIVAAIEKRESINHKLTAQNWDWEVAVALLNRKDIPHVHKPTEDRPSLEEIVKEYPQLKDKFARIYYAIESRQEMEPGTAGLEPKLRQFRHFFVINQDKFVR